MSIVTTLLTESVLLSLDVVTLTSVSREMTNSLLEFKIA